jgi:DNA gyrase inhibitor GyrI/DNA-binding HxlR family transcriptional regulator
LSKDTVDILESYSENISEILKALAHKKRITLLSRLIQGQATFKELGKLIKQSKTALAHHLELLVTSKLVILIDRGLYSITDVGKKFVETFVAAFSDSDIYKSQERAKRSDFILSSHMKSGRTQDDFVVDLVELDPMRVVSIQAISSSPENDAWEKMKQWALPKGLLDYPDKHPVFGFNNPDPKPREKEYGYEFWIKIGSDMEVEEGISTKNVAGGLYAVASSKLAEDIDTDGVLKTWKKLANWVRNSEYQVDTSRKCLEKAKNPNAAEGELVLDLYEPIKKG